MAEKRYQRGGLDEGIAEYLGLKGQLNSEVESVIRPNLTVRDLSDTPYSRDAVPVAKSMTGTAVVGEFTYVMIAAGFFHNLQISQLILTQQGAANQSFSIRLLSAVDVAAMGAATLTEQFKSLNTQFPSEGVWVDRPSIMSHLSDPSATFGTTIATIVIPVGTSVIWTLPPAGIILTGRNDPAVGSRPRLAVRASTNETVLVQAIGREWPLPG